MAHRGNGNYTHSTVKAIPKSKRMKPSIDDKTVVEISRLCNLVESHYKSPQDIEWACVGGKVYLLQSRPITTLTNSKDVRNSSIKPPTVNEFDFYNTRYRLDNNLQRTGNVSWSGNTTDNFDIWKGD